jgi:dTDP-3-amino-3,4,6-trideoxy-alpha-D-glucose transaminase
MSDRRIPFLSLVPGEDASSVRAAIERVVSRGWFVLGPEVEAFEAEFAKASGARHAIGVGSGTDAIALTLRALGIGAGDEVITTPLSAAYSALAIVMAGARPIFADIESERLTIDPQRIEALVSRRTRAILPVHLYGQAADMTPIERIAARHHLAVVEDCCQAHLATSEGRPVGTIGVAGAFSFYPTKNLGALGDAGAIVTNDSALADRVRRLRNGGQTDRYHHQEPGVNSRLDELQAAVLLAKLAFLPRWTARRRALAARYRERLREAPGSHPALQPGPAAVPAPGVPALNSDAAAASQVHARLSDAEPAPRAAVRAVPEADPGHVYHLFVVRVGGGRHELQRSLAARGIETLIHYPVPIPHQPAFGAFGPSDCPIASRVCNEILSLPLHPRLDADDIDWIAAALKGWGACVH